MALAFSLVDTWDDGKRVHVAGTVSPFRLRLRVLAWLGDETTAQCKSFSRPEARARSPNSRQARGAITSDTVTFYGIFKKLL